MFSQLSLWGVQKPDPTILEAVSKIHDGVGVLYDAFKAKAWKVVEFTGMKDTVNQVNTLARKYTDVVFLALNVYNFWQNWMFFVLGAVSGLAISDKGPFDDSLQLLNSKQSMVEYNFFAVACYFLFSQPVNSFAQGFFLGNRLGCPQVPERADRPNIVSRSLRQIASLIEER